jgi:hypothetical protein
MAQSVQAIAGVIPIKFQERAVAVERSYRIGGVLVADRSVPFVTFRPITR